MVLKVPVRVRSSHKSSAREAKLLQFIRITVQDEARASSKRFNAKVIQINDSRVRLVFEEVFMGKTGRYRIPLERV